MAFVGDGKRSRSTWEMALVDVTYISENFSIEPELFQAVYAMRQNV